MGKIDHHTKAIARDSSGEERKWILANVRGGYYKTSPTSRWTITANPRDATRFTKEKAQNILTNSLPKDQAKNWIVILASKANKLTLDTVIDEQKQATQDIVISSAETSNNADLYTIIPERFRNGSFDWVAYEADRVNLRRDLQEYLQVLLKLEIQNHREEIDIRHKIELGKKPNVVEGYKLLMRYRENLVTRRRIKNDILRCQAMLENEDAHNSGEVLGKLDAIEKQRYNPRALKDLFDNESFVYKKDEEEHK